MATWGIRIEELADMIQSFSTRRMPKILSHRVNILRLSISSFSVAGYGLEDDEKKPGDTSFITTLGSSSLIAALSDGVPGMAPGSIRRISILPQMGWRLPGKQCDGGPGGSGAGGELKTDYVVVPTATMVNEEACFDKEEAGCRPRGRMRPTGKARCRHQS